MPTPISGTAAGLDLSPRVFTTSVVAASPAAATETVVASVTITGDIAAIFGVILVAFLAFTVGTDGVSATAQVKQTNAAGTSKGSTGAINATAANLTERNLIAIDTTPTLPGQVYALTLTVASASAPSAVSQARILAIVV